MPCHVVYIWGGWYRTQPLISCWHNSLRVPRSQTKKMSLMEMQEHKKETQRHRRGKGEVAITTENKEKQTNQARLRNKIQVDTNQGSQLFNVVNGIIQCNTIQVKCNQSAKKRVYYLPLQICTWLMKVIYLTSNGSRHKYRYLYHHHIISCFTAPEAFLKPGVGRLRSLISAMPLSSFTIGGKKAKLAELSEREGWH